jgi:hypothetical protein
MALFPKCGFEVLVPDGVVVPGTTIEGMLVLQAPELIPRAEHVQLDFISRAWAGYGSGKSRSVVRRTMFHAPLHIDLPNASLPAGRHQFPFKVDVPAWLPPAFVGSDCAIEHVIETRLDVDWAIDPVAKLSPRIALPPGDASRTSLTTRSHAHFHETIVLEVTLASSVIAIDEPLSGQIALRSGHSARFDAVDLTLAGSMRIAMGRGDRRRGGGNMIRIPAEALRGGEAVPFHFPPNMHILPTCRNNFIDYDVMLNVSVDIPWASDPSFDLLLHVLPRGSTIHGEATASIVGGERLRRIAAGMAQATGFREGHAPTLVEGTFGPISVRIDDAPREAKLGIDVDITFPDVELGTVFRPLGVLEGFRESPLMPRGLGTRYLLRCKPADERPPVDDAALAAFLESVLADLRSDQDIRFSDHHLGIHFSIPNDELPRMIDIARAAHAKAKGIADAIGKLPMPTSVAAARPAWEATAAEQSAFFVPSGPSLHGLSFRARVLGGEERVIGASFRTVWTKEGPTTHVDVDLRDAPLPKEAWAELVSETPTERMRAVRVWFPSAFPLERGQGVTLERSEFTSDPRALLPAIETFMWWVLDVRGERRADVPYR